MTSYNNNYKKYYNHKNFNNDYSYKKLIYFLNKIMNFLLVFGCIANLIIFIFYGLELAGLISFIGYSIVGIIEITIKTIRYINNRYNNIWNN